MKTIPITEIQGFKIGQVENTEAATGATVIICADGMAAGLDVRGGGPASRDSRILDPLAAAERIHAVLLAGGSAFGLDAAGGVQQYLEERGVGLEVGSINVPLVCQSDIFDLLVGSSAIRPDAAMGYAACLASETSNYHDGNHGAGCGATVGKALGPEFCMKSGIGSYAMQIGSLQIGAIMVVNALGDVRDPMTGRTIAGLLSEDKQGFRPTTQALLEQYEKKIPESARRRDEGETLVSNTTIGAVITNAALTKAQLCKVAGMAHDGMARAISPVHTSMDGDSVYALSSGSATAELDLIGICAAEVTAQAIIAAVCSAEPAYGMKSARSMR